MSRRTPDPDEIDETWDRAANVQVGILVTSDRKYMLFDPELNELSDGLYTWEEVKNEIAELERFHGRGPGAHHQGSAAMSDLPIDPFDDE